LTRRGRHPTTPGWLSRVVVCLRTPGVNVDLPVEAAVVPVVAVAGPLRFAVRVPVSVRTRAVFAGYWFAPVVISPQGCVFQRTQASAFFVLTQARFYPAFAGPGAPTGLCNVVPWGPSIGDDPFPEGWVCSSVRARLSEPPRQGSIYGLADRQEACKERSLARRRQESSALVGINPRCRNFAAGLS
jgi:hypothetical protein